MGSAQSARGIQLGGSGTAARCVGIPSRDPRPGPAGPPPGAFPPLRRCAATGSGSAWKGSGAKVARWPQGGELYSALPPGLRRFPGPWTRYFSAPSPLPFLSAGHPGRSPPSGGGGRGPAELGRARRGRGPPPPARLFDRDGLPSVRPNRVAPPRAGTAAHVHGAQGVSGDVGNPPDPS